MTDAEMTSVDKMVTTYIKKIVYGVRADYFNKEMTRRRRGRLLSESMRLGEEISISHSTAVCGHCNRCQYSNLCAAMDELTERQRFILIKIYFEMYAEHEVGEMLGLSQQAVHFSKTKALNRLREVMENPN